MRWTWWPSATPVSSSNSAAAMAAGCTVAEEHFEVFEQGLAQVAQEWLDAATLTHKIRNRRPLAPNIAAPTSWDTCTAKSGARAFAAYLQRRGRGAEPAPGQ